MASIKSLFDMSVLVLLLATSSFAQDVGGGAPGDNCEDAHQVSVITLAPVPISQIQGETITFEGAVPAWMTPGAHITLAECLNPGNNIEKTIDSIAGANSVTVDNSLITESASPGVAFGATVRIINIWRSHHPSDELPEIMLIWHYDPRLYRHEANTTTSLVYENTTVKICRFHGTMGRFGTVNDGILLHEFSHALDKDSKGCIGTTTTVGSGFLGDINADFSKVTSGQKVFVTLADNTLAAVTVTSIDILNRKLFLSPQITPGLNKRYFIFNPQLGQGNHWDGFFNVGGSYLHGGNWTDNGDGTFTQGQLYSNYSPYDLYMAGIKPWNELEDSFLILSPSPQSWNTGVTISGSRDDWSLLQIFGSTGVAPFPNYRRNAHVRCIIVTSVGKPVIGAIVDNTEEVRKDLNYDFQNDSAGPPPAFELRGSLTSVLNTSLPDLLIAEISDSNGSPLLRAASGQSLSAKAVVHNQSEIAAMPPGGIPITARTLPGPTSVLGSYTATSLDPFELETATFSFSVPSEFLLFGFQSYRGSFRVKVTADDPGSVAEGDELHNARSVPMGWGPALSVNVALGGAPTSGAVSAGPRFYVGYEVAGEHRLGELRADNPLSPLLVNYRVLPAKPTALAAGTDRIVVGMATTLHVYSLPLNVSETPQTWSAPTAISTMAVKDTYVYVGTKASGIKILSGLGGTLQNTGTLATSNCEVKELHIAKSGTPLHLFVATSGLTSDVTTDGVYDYTLQQPSSPQYIRTLLPGVTCTSLSTDATATYVYVATAPLQAAEDQEIRSVRLSDGQIMNTVHCTSRDPTWYALNVHGNGLFLIVRSRDNMWQSLLISNGILSHAGDLVVGAEPDIAATQSWSASFERWAVLSDAYGVRLFSPSGVTDRFKRGDATGDGVVNSQDYDRIFNYVFGDATACGRYDSFDVNDNGSIDISDAVYLSNYINGTGPAPPPPFATAGTDPTLDSLTYTMPR